MEEKYISACSNEDYDEAMKASGGASTTDVVNPAGHMTNYLSLAPAGDTGVKNNSITVAHTIRNLSTILTQE